MAGSWGRLDTVEKGISELENSCKEITQNSGKKEKRLKTKKKWLRDIGAIMRKSN